MPERRVSFWRRGRTRQASQAQLSLESLEQRLPLDGDVTVTFFGGSVRIDGDAQDNEITLMVSGGDLTLTGQNSTTINGVAGPLTLASGGDRVHGTLDIRMESGDDVVVLDGVFASEMLRVFAGLGNDRIQLTDTESRKLHIRGNEGDDVVQLESVRTTRWTTMRLDAGDDVLSVNGLTAGKNISIMGDDGEDAVATTGMTTGKKLYFTTDNGADQAVLFGETRVSRRADVGLGDGDDFFAILPDRDGSNARFSKRLKVWMGDGEDSVATDTGVTARRLRINGARGIDSFDNGGNTQRRQSIRNVENRQVADLETRIDALFARLSDVGIDPAPFGGDPTAAPLDLNVNSTNLAYTEGDASVPIDSALTLTGGTANVTGATVTITSGLASDEDALSFTNQFGITGSYDSSTGILMLTGTASVTDYQSALRSVAYSNSSEDPTERARVISVTVQRDAETVSAMRTIDVSAVNDAPTVTLSSNMVTFNAADLPAVLDSSALIADVDDDELTSLTLTIGTGYQQGADELSVSGQASTIDASFDSATGTLTLSGVASLADYQNALRLVAFENESESLGSGMRVVTITADDGVDHGSATLTIGLDGNVEPPVVTATSQALVYTEGDGPVTVDDQISIADSDSEILTSATIQFSSGYVEGEDVLGFTNQLGIVGSFDAGTGLLTLSGMAATADYQTALRSVTYENSSEDPSEAARTVRFEAFDGTNTGNASRTVNVVGVNDPLSLIVPSAVPPSGSVTIELGGAPLTLLFDAEDLDDSAFVFQLDLEEAGIDQADSQPTIDATTGEFTWQPTSAGVFEIRVIVVNESGQADQQLISFEVTALQGNL